LTDYLLRQHFVVQDGSTYSLVWAGDMSTEQVELAIALPSFLHAEQKYRVLMLSGQSPLFETIYPYSLGHTSLDKA